MQKQHKKKAQKKGRRHISGLMIVTGTILAILLIATIFAPLIAPYKPEKLDLAHMLQGPSPAHIFGTDKVGRDIFSRALYGGRTTLLSAALVVLISVVIGVPLGLYTGYYGGRVDKLVSNIWNVILSFPSILLAFVLMTIIGKGIRAGIIAMGIFYTPMISRLTRSLTTVEKNKTYVEAERDLGASDLRIMYVHILPNALPTMIAELTLDLAYAILDLAGLSFLGLGVQPPMSDWGYMLSDAQQFITTNPLQAFVPGCLIIISVVSLNLLSNELLDMFSPDLAGRRALKFRKSYERKMKHARTGISRKFRIRHAGPVITAAVDGLNIGENKGKANHGQTDWQQTTAGNSSSYR